MFCFHFSLCNNTHTHTHNLLLIIITGVKGNGAEFRCGRPTSLRTISAEPPNACWDCKHLQLTPVTLLWEVSCLRLSVDIWLICTLQLNRLLHTCIILLLRKVGKIVDSKELSDFSTDDTYTACSVVKQIIIHSHATFGLNKISNFTKWTQFFFILWYKASYFVLR